MDEGTQTAQEEAGRRFLRYAMRLLDEKSEARAKVRIMHGFGVGYSTVKRWCAGQTTIPPYAWTMLDLLDRVKSGVRTLPAGFDRVNRPD